MKTFLIWSLVLLMAAASSCTKDNNEQPTPPTPGKPPKRLVKIALNLQEVQSDLAARKITTRSAAFDNIRFRLSYEIKTDTSCIQNDSLFNISASVIQLSDSLLYGEYQIALFGNYVFVDEKGNITDEQYHIDPDKGLSKVTILHPEENREWAYAYSSTDQLSVSSYTDKVEIPIYRRIMQIQFTLDYNPEETPQGAVSDITLKNLSNCLDVYEAKAYPENSLYELTGLPHNSINYYRVTFFDSPQDCRINYQYRYADGSTTDYPEYFNNEIYKPLNQPINPYPLTENNCIFFGMPQSPVVLQPGTPDAVILPIRPTTTTGQRLFGDEVIFQSQGRSHVLPADSMALVSFYENMNGPGWNQPWNLHLPISTWAGISLSNTTGNEPQRVISINMQSNNLKGTATGLGALSELKELALEGNFNGFDNILPQSTQLEDLSIHNSRFSDITSLKEPRPDLILPNSLIHLKSLYLHNINIVNFNQIGQNPELASFWVTACSVPDGTTLFDNTLPLSNLQRIYLTLWGEVGCSLSDDFYRLESLNSLQIEFSSARLDINKVIAAWPDMESLSFGASSLSGQEIPSTITQLQKLESLSFYSSGIRGEIPAAIGEMPALRGLIIKNEVITGALPANLLAKNMNYIEIVNTPLSGELPKLPADWQGDKLSIIVPNNQFTGNIPKEYAQATKLTLKIDQNQFSGEIPQEIKAHPNWESWTPAKNIYPQQEGYGFSN